MDTATLLLETLRLGAARRSDETSARLAPSWARASTRGLARLVAYEGCALWLSRRLGELGIVPVPEVLKDLKRGVFDQAARNMLVDAEAHAVQGFLADMGIPCVLLKGTARRAAAARYPYADARATSDVDILLPRASAQRAWDGLRERGYTLVLGPGEGLGTTHHMLPLWGPARVSVELHTTMMRGLPPDEGWRRATAGATEITWDGQRAVVPSATELLWHAIAHGVGHGDDAYRLRYLLDVTAICASGEPIDWQTVAGRLDAGEIRDARGARGWLGAAAWLGGAHMPAEVTAGVAPFDFERVVRWRLAVLGRFGWRSRVGHKLLAEGTRSEIGLGLSRAAAQESALVQARHAIASAMARGAYGVWKDGVPFVMDLGKA